jgi:hypothetical protein
MFSVDKMWIFLVLNLVVDNLAIRLDKGKSGVNNLNLIYYLRHNLKSPSFLEHCDTSMKDRHHASPFHQGQTP